MPETRVDSGIVQPTTRIDPGMSVCSSLDQSCGTRGELSIFLFSCDTTYYTLEAFEAELQIPYRLWGPPDS